MLNLPFEQRITASFRPPCHHKGGGSQPSHPRQCPLSHRAVAWAQCIPGNLSHILGHDFDATYKAWGTIQKIILLREVAQTLMYSRCSNTYVLKIIPSLINVRLFVRTMLSTLCTRSCKTSSNTYISPS